jgi:hypothetical protein
MVRRTRSVWERYHIDTWVLEGAERVSREPIRVLFAGQRENCAYIVHVVFSEAPVKVQRRKMWRSAVWSLLRQPDMPYALIWIQTEDAPVAEINRRVCFAIPSWIAGELDVVQALASPQASTSVSRDMRHVRRNRFLYRVTRNRDELESFYANMYLPYIRQTHGEGAFVATLEEFAREAEKGAELLIVEQDSNPVAGVLLGRQDHECMVALELGVWGADRRLVKAGALAAVYGFSLQHASARGYRRLFLGGARPFLNDGALQYKKKWGLRITGRLHTMPGRLVLKPNLALKSVASFLRNNPFVYEDKEDAFRVAVFVDAGNDLPVSSEVVEQFYDAHVIPGLQGVSVFTVGGAAGSQAIANRSVAPESAADFRSAAVAG